MKIVDKSKRHLLSSLNIEEFYDLNCRTQLGGGLELGVHRHFSSESTEEHCRKTPVK